ncbi:glyoxalase family protein [Cystoisospora suis]|uniref:Glyoxalase family protein n=1 Tax=Cystoisospora suis TaxID=483139 RepID=A0A2C6LF78_9APIC|nr:glyoxalase family protein [Cystoisospora suis]
MDDKLRFYRASLQLAYIFSPLGSDGTGGSHFSSTDDNFVTSPISSSLAEAAVHEEPMNSTTDFPSFYSPAGSSLTPQIPKSAMSCAVGRWGCKTREVTGSSRRILGHPKKEHALASTDRDLRPFTFGLHTKARRGLVCFYAGRARGCPRTQGVCPDKGCGKPSLSTKSLVNDGLIGRKDRETTRNNDSWCVAEQTSPHHLLGGRVCGYLFCMLLVCTFKPTFATASLHASELQPMKGQGPLLKLRYGVGAHPLCHDLSTSSRSFHKPAVSPAEYVSAVANKAQRRSLRRTRVFWAVGTQGVIDSKPLVLASFQAKRTCDQRPAGTRKAGWLGQQERRRCGMGWSRRHHVHRLDQVEGLVSVCRLLSKTALYLTCSGTAPGKQYTRLRLACNALTGGTSTKSLGWPPACLSRGEQDSENAGSCGLSHSVFSISSAFASLAEEARTPCPSSSRRKGSGCSPRQTASGFLFLRAPGGREPLIVQRDGCRLRGTTSLNARRPQTSCIRRVQGSVRSRWHKNENVEATKLVAVRGSNRSFSTFAVAQEHNASTQTQPGVSEQGDPCSFPGQGGGSMEVGPRRLLHVRLRVRDLSKMVRFYTEILGMRVLGYAFTPSCSRGQTHASSDEGGGGSSKQGSETFRGKAGDAMECPGPVSVVGREGNKNESTRPDTVEVLSHGFASWRQEAKGGSATAAAPSAWRVGEGFVSKPNRDSVRVTAQNTGIVSGSQNADAKEEGESSGGVDIEALIAQHRRESQLHPPHVETTNNRGARGSETTAALRRAADAAEFAGPRTTVLLGYPLEESGSTRVAARSLDTLKIELVYVPRVSELLARLDERTRTEDASEERQFLRVLRQHMMGHSKDLPTLNRARQFERRRNRLDRGFHGFLGFTACLPSLEMLTDQAVEAHGGKLFQLPAKRKIVPSMVPDEHARKDIWVQCAYVLDPEGNGVEVTQITDDSSIGLVPASAMQEHHKLRSWEAYMHHQERDVRLQEVKRQILQLRPYLEQRQERPSDEERGSVFSPKNPECRNCEPGQQRAENGNVQQSLGGEAEALRKALNIRVVGDHKTHQERLELLEDALEAMQQEAATQQEQPYVQLQARKKPFLQKVRAYTGRMLVADRFYCRQMQMALVRYKSHLFERLYPWSRFAGVSKTFGCPRSFARAVEGASALPEADQAAEAGVEEFSEMEKIAQGGDMMSIPAEWESESSTDPAGASRKAYATEAAERQVPQLEMIYAFDEDIIRIHPCFGYLAIGVDDVAAAVAAYQAHTPLHSDTSAEGSGDENGDETEPARTCAADPSPSPASCGSPDSAPLQNYRSACDAAQEAFAQSLRRSGLELNTAMVRDADGYPIMLMRNEWARRYYEQLHCNLLMHENELQRRQETTNREATVSPQGEPGRA